MRDHGAVRVLGDTMLGLPEMGCSGIEQKKDRDIRDQARQGYIRVLVQLE